MAVGLRSAAGAPAVLGVVGRSGSGKTSLLTHLIPALDARGLAVAAVKHSSHDFLADRPGKDSFRLYDSGARAVALVSRDQRATFTRLHCDPNVDPSLADALMALPTGLDLVLVEGFSWEPIPRLVVVAGSKAPLLRHLEPGEVIRIVRLAEPAPGERPAISSELIEALADELTARTHDQRRTLECARTTSAAIA